MLHSSKFISPAHRSSVGNFPSSSAEHEEEKKDEEDREEQQKDKLQQAQGKPQEPENDNKNWIVVLEWDTNNLGEIQNWNPPLRVFR